MCGIIGYIGNKDSTSILIEGLKKLEYRGYDSAGICVKTKEGLKVFKKRGRIFELEKLDELKELKGMIGIAHTRWATHGEPNENNAHPHFDCSKNIAIVHNGIIENYHALKNLLEKEGHQLSSQTDSEIFAHLVEKFYEQNLEKAVIKTLKLVEGSYGLVVMHKKEEKLIVARKGSSLIIGVGEGEMFVASDSAALLEHTKKVVHLQDEEIATITKDKYIIKNIDGEFVNKKIEEIKWTVEQMEKKGFKHFMLKEIFEQPQSITDTIRGRIKDRKIKITVDFRVDSIKRIIITACGTSWHSALIGKYFIEELTQIPVEVDYASEFRYRNPVIGKDDLVIVISQSGETADTLAALRGAKEKQAKTLGIINVVGSTISREVDSGIYLHAGPEIGVASTKAFTSQVVALLIFALYIRQKKGQELDQELLRELEELPQKVKEVLKTDKEVQKIAKEFTAVKNFLYLGRGINFPVALEGALKLKEISYIHAEGYPAAEIKHGPIALIDEQMPVLFVATKNNLSAKIISNMQEVKARKGKIIALVNEDNKEIKELADYLIKVPQIINELSPVINVIPLQLLSYYIADIKGIDMDKPRNLAKSVTVE
ncbi:glutamine--fructose-6-phosphate transaminase (isomerizing) [Patescibacteria group bacterium]|nr:glutamine--fructose-6-phosphate transaminase (isomerizing) [Patescibacteria group bacterium]